MAEPSERPGDGALVQLTLNGMAEVAPSLPPRSFYVRDGDVADADIVRHVFTDHAYGVERTPGGPTNAARLAKRLQRIVRDGKRPLIVDAGAMIGASAVYYQLTIPQSLVVAVEPEPGNFALMQKNCEGLNVRLLAGAVASTQAPLFLSDPGAGRYGFRTAATGLYEVPAFTLDGILGDCDPALFEPFLCKINIEGGEADLFRSNVNWLDRFAAVAIELHDWMLPGTASSRNFLRAITARNFDLTNAGYVTFCFNNDVLGGFGPEIPQTTRLRPEPALGHVDRAMVTGLGDGRRETTRPLILPPGSRLQVEGWGADPEGRSTAAGLVARIGGLQLDVSSGYGQFRHDVSAALGEPAFAASGFDVAIEARLLPAGRHDVRLGIVAANGDIFDLSDPLDVIVL